MEHLDQTTYMCTVYAIGIYRGHEDSQLSQKSQIATRDDQEKLDIVLKEERAFKQAMDWIGNLFVHGTAGDVIAIAATIDNTTSMHKVIFHISNNIGGGRPAGSKKNDWTSFLGIMNRIKVMDLSTPEGLRSGSQLYVRHIVEVGWSRVKQKYGSIRNTVTAETFAALLQSLLAGKFLTLADISLVYQKGGNETDDAFLQRGIKGLENSMSNLLNAAQKGRAGSFDNATKDEHLENLNGAIESSKTIVLVINAILNRHKPGKREAWGNDLELKKLTLKLHNRLTRIIKFESGAKVFLHYCLDIYRRFASLAQTSDLQFEVAWVEEYILDASIPNTPIASYNKTNYLAKLEEIKEELFKGKKDEFNVGAYETLIDLVTKSFDEKPKKKEKLLSLNPSLHCEISLAHYLEAKNLHPLYNFIGVTKLNCVSCTRYLRAYNDAPNAGVGFEMTGSSGKWHHNWFIPKAITIKGAVNDPELISKMQENMRSACLTVVQSANIAIYNILSRDSSPRSSIGSDSTTGSMNQVLVL